MALGRLHSSISEEIVNDVPLGPSAMIVWIDEPLNPEAFLWRPSPGLFRIGDAAGKKVAWPESQVVVETSDNTVTTTTKDVVKTFTVLDFYVVFLFFQGLATSFFFFFQLADCKFKNKQ